MKKLILSSFVLLAASLSMLVFSPVVSAQFSQSVEQACAGLGVENEDGTGEEFVDCDADDGSDTLNRILTTVLNILSVIAGVIAVIMIIIAGITFMTSQGDPSKVSTARQTIIYAVIGIVVVAISQSLILFVLKSAESGRVSTPPPPDPCAEVRPLPGENVAC